MRILSPLSDRGSGDSVEKAQPHQEQESKTMTQTKNALPAYLNGSKTSGSKATIEREEQHLATTFVRAATIDSTFSYMGSLMTFLAKSSETGGRFALMEYYTKPGNEPPPHVHEREHELYFVLEGSMRFYCEDKILDIKAGEVVFLPQGKAHAFNCTSPVVRTLILVQAIGADPVVLDNYFLTMSEPARDMSLPRDAITYAVDDPERAIRIAALYGVRILSPLEAEKELPQYPGFGVSVR
jgi:mannose-6-phosphate isomerase-like protein (cupin superfamily)